jgi:hypothetical protein
MYNTYVCMYVCIYIRTCVQMYNTYVCMNVCMYVRVYTCTHTQRETHTHTHSHTHLGSGGEEGETRELMQLDPVKRFLHVLLRVLGPRSELLWVQFTRVRHLCVCTCVCVFV